jgi:hypothetical protein
MSEKFQRFQQLALKVKVEITLTTSLRKDLKISLAEAQAFMANIVIRFILAFKELIWKPRCEKVILWEREKGISQTDKITPRDNLNYSSSNKVKDGKYKLTDISNRQTGNKGSTIEVHDNSYISNITSPPLQTRKIDWVQNSVALTKITMDNL